MDVGIVTVGDELLAGDTVNTNATWLCTQLRERGAHVRRVIVVPDDIDDIASVVRSELAEDDAVIVTGGVGPTHDDVTLDALAEALDRELVVNEDARRWLTETGGYAAEDLVPGTAALPEGATPIHNPVGVAPGAKVEGIYVFPGVPAEMQAMFERVAEEFTGERSDRRVVTVDEPESHLLERFDELKREFDVTVGSYPGDSVKVLLTGSNQTEVNRAATWLAERSETILPEDGPQPDDGDDHAPE